MGINHDKVVSGLISDRELSKIREAVCIQTEKVYDSCREKDCIEDAKVIFKHPQAVQGLINAAINVKVRKAEVLDVYIDIEPVPFKRGFYTVDVKFFIRVTLDFFVPNGMGPAGTTIVTKNGLIVFDKKVILFGSEGNVKIFKSKFIEGEIDTQVKSHLQQDNLPIGKVEVAEPIALNARIQDIFDKLFDDHCCDNLPRSISDALDDNDDGVEYRAEIDERHGGQLGQVPTRRVVVTVGIFSIIKLVRFVQLLIPAFDFCVPNKQCVAATEENPCDLFDTICFPVDEFFPPQINDFPGARAEELKMLGDTED